MGLREFFNRFRKVSLEILKKDKYREKYFNELKFIWASYVPKSGKSPNFQGEMLRLTERLRIMINEEKGLTGEGKRALLFIKEKLLKRDELKKRDKDEIEIISDYLLEEEGDTFIRNKFLTIIAEKVGKIHKVHGEDIPL